MGIWARASHQAGRSPTGAAKASPPSGDHPSRKDFSLADVLAWARTKPAEQAYNFCDPRVCALGQFAQEEAGFSEGDAACERYDALVARVLRAAVQGEGEYHLPATERWTFGALVARLEKLAPQTVIPPSEWTRLDAYMNDVVVL